LSRLRDRFLPGKKSQFTDRELNGLAGAFNLGEDRLKDGDRIPFTNLDDYFKYPEDEKKKYAGEKYALPAFRGLNDCGCNNEFK
jgi:hypothetical protein